MLCCDKPDTVPSGTESDLNLVFVNIEGIKNMCQSLDYLKKFHLIICAETWNEVNDNMVSGYKKVGETFAKKNCTKKGRKSGGIVVFARDEIFHRIQVNKDCKPSHNTIIFEIDDIACIATYRTPEGSVYFEKDYFKQLRDTIAVSYTHLTLPTILRV